MVTRNEDNQYDDLIRGLQSPHFKINASDEDDLFDNLLDDTKKKDDDDDDLLGDDVDDTTKKSQTDDILDDDINDDTDDKDTKSTTKVDNKTSKDAKTDVADLDQFESEIATHLANKLSDKLGEDLGDLTSIEEVVDRLAELVQESSVPEFANNDIAALDKYVRDGGDLRKFYEDIYTGRANPDEIDLKDEADQKRIIRQSLKDAGYNDSQIKRKIERYEDAGVLEDEAEEAVELVKEYDEKNKKKLLKEQENFRIESENRNKKFVSDVQSSIKALKEIGGVPITDKKKKELLNFIFTVDKDGTTPYQKKYSSDIKHLLTSAYFTMEGDAIFQKAASQGASTLAKELKDKLAQKGKRNSSSVSQIDDDGPDALEVFSRHLRRF